MFTFSGISVGLTNSFLRLSVLYLSSAASAASSSGGLFGSTPLPSSGLFGSSTPSFGTPSTGNIFGGIVAYLFAIICTCKLSEGALSSLVCQASFFKFIWSGYHINIYCVQLQVLVPVLEVQFLVLEQAKGYA